MIYRKTRLTRRYATRNDITGDCRAPKAVLAMTEEDERYSGMMGLPRRYAPRNDRKGMTK